MMKKKTGLNLGVIATCVAVGIYVAYGQKRKKMIGTNFFTDEKLSEAAKIYNPKSSFIEFFDKKNIQEAYNRYEKYVDLGLNKDDAFKAVVEDNRNT